tara:strand:+ start:253 stop:522 length:270 start_codon:yes stop_codon:yes gene_type:complete
MKLHPLRLSAISTSLTFGEIRQQSGGPANTAPIAFHVNNNITVNVMNVAPEQLAGAGVLPPGLLGSGSVLTDEHSLKAVVSGEAHPVRV